MTPLSCNCLSRPAPSLVILCSEPTRRSPGIVSCSGSHQPVQTLTLLCTPPPPSLLPQLLSVVAGAVDVRHWQCLWQTVLDTWGAGPPRRLHLLSITQETTLTTVWSATWVFIMVIRLHLFCKYRTGMGHSSVTRYRKKDICACRSEVQD